MKTSNKASWHRVSLLRTLCAASKVSNNFSPPLGLLANSNFNVGKRRGQGYESGSPVEWEAVPTFGLVGKLRSIV